MMGKGGGLGREEVTNPFCGKDALVFLFNRLFEERLARNLWYWLGQLLLPVQAEAHSVPLFEPAPNLGTMLLNQAVVAAAGGKDILDLLVVQASKENASAKEGLVDAAQRRDVDLARQAKFLGVLVHLSQVRQGGCHLLAVFGPLEEVPQLSNRLAGSVYEMLAGQRIRAHGGLRSARETDLENRISAVRPRW